MDPYGYNPVTPGKDRFRRSSPRGKGFGAIMEMVEIVKIVKIVDF